ncbi:MAG: hypothetical protein HKN62_07450 [Phycisphaerales bacterium]|nr:hypothetical protein [Phycisphaerales bacterium]
MLLNKLARSVTAVCVLAIGAGVAVADTICVPDDYPTIQGAIDAAVDGDEICVTPGTYPERIALIGKEVRLYSLDGPATTIIDAGGSGSVVTCSGATERTRIEGLTITGGQSSYGGGVRLSGRAVVIDCIVTGNLGHDAGGGMHIGAGHPTVIGCVITANEGGSLQGGGGVYCESATIVDCTISGNHSYETEQAGSASGGGVRSGDGTWLVGCRVIGNVAHHAGLVAGSVAGGGVFGAGWLVNCVIAENVAEGEPGVAGIGGGVAEFVFAGELRLINCVVIDNRAEDEMSGEARGGGAYGATLINSVVWGNAPDQLDEVEAVYSCVQGGWPGIGNITADPRLDDNGRLQAGSPCIDAGHNWAAPADTLDLDEDGRTNELIPFDLDGNPRFNADEIDFDPGCGVPVVVDMGAFEYQFDPVEEILVADVDGDGMVAFTDLLAVLAAWGDCDADCCLADVDFSWEVDFGDLLLVLANWT